MRLLLDRLPDRETETRIVMTRVPGIGERLASEVAAFAGELRQADVYKTAGVSETLDWAAALVALGCQELTPATIDETLGLLLKNQEDIQTVRGEAAAAMLVRARAAGTRQAGPS
jgi:MoxR-like ATPase